MPICFKVRLVAYAFTLLLSLSALSHAAPLPLSPSLEALLRLSHWRRPLFHNSSSDALATVLILADFRDGVEQERLLTFPPPKRDGSTSPDRLRLEKRRPWLDFIGGDMGDLYMPKKLRSKMLKSVSQVLPPLPARSHAEQSTKEGEQVLKRSTTMDTSGTSLTSRFSKCE
ncbi:hypothetical protein FA10DRAFT_43379 [Acaromyces ingoldii]|uniref:Uncharacterized protein n=1 Tax=Acaromyces ingoldii TaxID=215250 RepID=A0A316YYE9_9BASI|nr:hypothetical protein FA10DRAFT_43379 [Acaromyces ingoldii]PWN94211.1 hypothetical protein FA10DRAFT_43379 [Acaromyces ingoldii]